jgi:hypothetical protein
MNGKPDEDISDPAFRVAYIYIHQYYDQLVAHWGGNFVDAREEFDSQVGVRLGFSLAKNYYYTGSLQEAIFRFVEYLADNQKLAEGLKLVAACSGRDIGRTIIADRPPPVPSEILQLNTDPYPGEEMDRLRLAVHQCFHPWRLAYIVRTVGNIRPAEVSAAYHSRTWAEIVEYVVGLAIEQGWLEKLQEEAEKFNPQHPYAEYQENYPQLLAADNKINELIDRLSSRVYAFGRRFGLESQQNIICLIEYLRQKYDWHSLKMMLRERCAQDLEALTGLEEDVSELVDTAKLEGWLNDLIAAAQREKPAHSAITEIHTAHAQDTEVIKYALLSGFEKNELVKLIKTLGKRWSEVSSAQAFFKAVIQHAEDQGWLPQFINAIYQDKPEHPQIEQAYEQYFYDYFPEILLYQTIVQKVKPEDFAYFVRTRLNKNGFGFNGQDFEQKVETVIVAAYRGKWLADLIHFLQTTWPWEETFQRLARRYPVTPAPPPVVGLTGADIEHLLHTLLRFYSFDDLRMMLRTRLEINIEALSLNSDLQGVVFDLLTKSNAQGWIDKLLAEAARYLPENEVLRQEIERVFPGIGAKAVI